jgi:hypoxanthine phosphoribosyltransferase
VVEAVSRVLIGEDEIRARVRELGAQITRDYAGRSVILVGILRGAVVFLADLIRAIDTTVMIDFIAVSSYGKSTKSSGVVRIFKDLNESIEGENVIIVEDIIDSGLTLAYLVDLLQRRNPAELKVCSFLLKERERHLQLSIDYVGFTIPDEFVIGYGLDYAGAYRNLPFVGVLAAPAQPSDE